MWLLATAAVLGLATLMIPSILRQALYPAPAVAVPSPPPSPLEEVVLAGPGGHDLVGWAGDGGAAASGRPAILFLHGNGENLATMQWSGTFGRLAEPGGPYLAIDYPGYGRSGGSPSADSLDAAGRLGIDWLAQRHPRSPLVVVGWSLGAAVAIRLAAENPERISGLVALSPWSSLGEVAKIHYPSWLVAVLPLADGYDSLRAARDVRCPSLVVHGADDSLIPATQGRRVAHELERAGRTRWLEVLERGHNDLLEDAAVWAELRSFLDAVAASRSKGAE